MNACMRAILFLSIFLFSPPIFAQGQWPDPRGDMRGVERSAVNSDGEVDADLKLKLNNELFFNWDSAQNNSIYSPADGQIRLKVGGTDRWAVSTSQVTLLAGTDINLNGNFLNDTTVAAQVGGSCTSTQGLGAGDVCVPDGLEVQGSAFFDGTTRFSTPTTFLNNIYAFEGQTEGLWVIGNTTESMVLSGDQNPLGGYLFLGTKVGRVFALADYDNISNNPSITLQTDPELRVYSATLWTSATDQYTSVTHNQTDGIVSTGVGDLNLTPAGKVEFSTAINHTSFWTIQVGGSNRLQLGSDATYSGIGTHDIGTAYQKMTGIACASLAAAGTSGRIKYVTDATAGNNAALCIDDGTNWVLSDGSGSLCCPP